MYKTAPSLAPLLLCIASRQKQALTSISRSFTSDAWPFSPSLFNKVDSTREQAHQLVSFLVSVNIISSLFLLFAPDHLLFQHPGLQQRLFSHSLIEPAPDASFSVNQN